MYITPATAPLQYRVQEPGFFGAADACGETFTSKLMWVVIGAAVVYVIPPLLGGVFEGAKEAITEDSARDTRRDFKLSRKRR